jgi:uncharacterized protein (DUF952 family)
VPVKYIYKIVAKNAWTEAQAMGAFKGTPIDLIDGYIHFSTAAQAPQTAALHFKGQNDLLLVAVATAGLGSALKWEYSRGGALFPHLYADLAFDSVSRVDALPLGADGVHKFPPMDETK